MTANEPLLQFQADVAATAVARPAIAETTAVGAAYAAGLAVGFWADTGELKGKWRQDKAWAPAMAQTERAALLRGWRRAVAKSLGWIEPEPAPEPCGPGVASYDGALDAAGLASGLGAAAHADGSRWAAREPLSLSPRPSPGFCEPTHSPQVETSDQIPHLIQSLR